MSGHALPAQREAREDPDYLCAHPGRVNFHADEDPHSATLGFPQQPEKQVLGTDVVVAPELLGLAKSELQGLLGPGGERWGDGGRGAAGTSSLVHLLSHHLEGIPLGRTVRSRRFPRPRGPVQAGLLSTDPVVIEKTGLFPGQDQASGMPRADTRRG